MHFVLVQGLYRPALGGNLREFSLAALYAEADNGYFGKPVTVCVLFAPSEGLHF